MSNTLKVAIFFFAIITSWALIRHFTGGPAEMCTTGKCSVPPITMSRPDETANVRPAYENTTFIIIEDDRGLASAEDKRYENDFEKLLDEIKVKYPDADYVEATDAQSVRLLKTLSIERTPAVVIAYGDEEHLIDIESAPGTIEELMSKWTSQ